MDNIKLKIKNKLIELADEKFKIFHSKLCPNTNNILGVKVPVLRNYAKELIKKYKTEELLKNIDNQYYEEIMLQGMIIGLSKENDFDVIKSQIKNFIPKIDNWAICDTFCAGLKITKKYKEEMWEFIQDYLKSQKEFYLRFAIVMILDFYIEEEYLEKNFEIFNNIKSDKYYVQMAIAWAVSICLIKYYNETIKYLKSKKCKLDDFTYNKALQKARESYRISKEQKEELQKMKKIKL